MIEKRGRTVQSEVQLICPYCGVIIQVPMCKTVNGEEIVCRYCNKKFKFGM